MKRSVLLSGCLLLAATTAWAGTPLWGPTEVGMSQEKVLELVDGARSAPKNGVCSVVADNLPVGKTWLDAMFCFNENGLISVNFELPRKPYDVGVAIYGSLLESLNGKYGTPYVNNVHNFGTMQPAARHKWDSNGLEVSLFVGASQVEGVLLNLRYEESDNNL